MSKIKVEVPQNYKEYILSLKVGDKVWKQSLNNMSQYFKPPYPEKAEYLYMPFTIIGKNETVIAAEFGCLPMQFNYCGKAVKRCYMHWDGDVLDTKKMRILEEGSADIYSHWLVPCGCESGEEIVLDYPIHPHTFIPSKN